MSLIRFSLDLAIPSATYNAMPAAKKLAVRDAIRDLKALSVRINAGSPNEEMSVKATYHVCHHDETIQKPCEPEVDI